MIAQNNKPLIVTVATLTDSPSASRRQFRPLQVLAKVGAAIRRDFERGDEINRQLEVFKEEAHRKCLRYGLMRNLY